MALSIGEIFRQAALSVPRQPAAWLDDEMMRFGELNRSGNQVAHALAAHGVGRGDRVIWWGDTTLAALPVFVALAKLGAIYAPINARLGTDEAAALVGFTRARALIVDSVHAERAENVARMTGVSPLLRVGGGSGPGVDLDEAAARASDQEPARADIAESDTNVMFFTSGSTGRPKGVLLSHRVNYLRSFQGALLGRATRTVCMFPLFHMAGWTLALGAWQARSPVAFVRTPSADALLGAIERHRATQLYCIPAVWSRILSSDLGAYDLRSLRDVDTGTSATSPELIAALREAFPGTSTRIMYGSTEAGAGTILSDADVGRKPGSVGLPAGGVELRLGEGDEVCLRSEFLMDGYFDNPQASAEVLREGWYHTGDIGTLDDEGYLSIVGRLRDTIRSGGETISPSEVEGVLRDHPAIQEVAVVGLPDAEWGEIVCAVVVPRPETRPALAELRIHCGDRLAAFKQPRRLELVRELPRTSATGQVQRTLLVERLTRGPLG